MDIEINGEAVVRRLDLAATAADAPANLKAQDRDNPYAGLNCAMDLVFEDVRPRRGVIAVRFIGCNGAQAIASAIEIGRGHGGQGAIPKTLPQ